MTLIFPALSSDTSNWVTSEECDPLDDHKCVKGRLTEVSRIAKTERRVEAQLLGSVVGQQNLLTHMAVALKDRQDKNSRLFSRKV